VYDFVGSSEEEEEQEELHLYLSVCDFHLFKIISNVIVWEKAIKMSHMSDVD
jgi:hypothetical protein